MSCPRSIEVEAARDGRLADRRSLDRHLLTCTDCRARAEQLAALARSLRALPDVQEDELAAQRARNRLVEAFDATPAPARRGRWVAAGGMVAAGAIYLVTARQPAPSPVAVSADSISIQAEHARWSRVDDATTTTVHLDDGDARIHVDHTRLSRRLVVRVPDGELDDIGTTFLVRVRNGHTIEVAVDEGRVTFVRDHDAPLVLTAGERWVPPEPVTVTAPSPPAPPPPAATRPRPTTKASTPAASAATGSAQAPIDGDLRDAVAALDAGDPQAAVKTLRIILARDPRAEDAAYLLVIALQRASDLLGARAAARDYLQRFPDGFRRAAIEPLAR